MVYEKFFANTLKREYKSLYEIDVRKEINKYDVGFPNSIVHAFLRKGCNTIGTINDYIQEHSVDSLRGIGKKKIEIATKMIKKYKDEALLSTFERDDILQFSKVEGIYKKTYEVNLEYPHYLCSLNSIFDLELDFYRSNDFTITIMSFNEGYQMIVNGIFEKCRNTYCEKESMIDISEKDYYHLISLLDKEIKETEKRYEI